MRPVPLAAMIASSTIAPIRNRFPPRLQKPPSRKLMLQAVLISRAMINIGRVRKVRASQAISISMFSRCLGHQGFARAMTKDGRNARLGPISDLSCMVFGRNMRMAFHPIAAQLDDIHQGLLCNQPTGCFLTKVLRAMNGVSTEPVRAKARPIISPMSAVRMMR
jgi:hypothetical protein